MFPQFLVQKYGWRNLGEPACFKGGVKKLERGWQAWNACLVTGKLP